jgi:hypothetical protein
MFICDVHYRASPFGTSGGQSGNGTGYAVSVSVVAGQDHSINAPYPFNLSPIVYDRSNWQRR